MKPIAVICLALLVTAPALAQQQANAPVMPAAPPPAPATVAAVAPTGTTPLVAAVATPSAAVTEPTAPTLAPAATPQPEAQPIVTLQPMQTTLPPLPPSRPCARPDADGIWKLKHVFEIPYGAESRDFAQQPHQYILFLRDDTFRVYKDTWGEKSDLSVKSEMEKSTPARPQQYIMHESGILYFYIDSKIVDTQACFIVANPRPPYATGQMILMPPEGASAVRIVKVFSRTTAGAANTNEEQPVIKRTPRRGRNN